MNVPQTKPPFPTAPEKFVTPPDVPQVIVALLPNVALLALCTLVNANALPAAPITNATAIKNVLSLRIAIPDELKTQYALTPP